MAVMAVLRALIVGAVMAAIVAGPVSAQGKPKETPMQQEEIQKKKDAEAIDQQYKSTLQKTNRNAVETAPNDPWSNMRGGDDSKTKR
jgi:hypothetical protein